MSKQNCLNAIATCLLAGLLAGCITTTTGGFLVTASDEEALQDYIQLAIAYYDANDLGNARRAVNSAMEIDDDHTEIYNVLALILQREGELDLAEANFRRAINLDRNNSRARNNYGALLFSRGDLEGAYGEFQQVTADTSYEGRAVAFENLGRVALRLARLDEAERAFGRALQLNSNLYVSALELSVLLVRSGDWQRARDIFQQYMTTVQFFSIPHSPRALLAGIQIEGYFQNQERVQQFVRQLTTQHGNSPEFQTYRRLVDGN
ncbi:MAG: type IV pilus biogenesis/stability protein PilW [Gammaproteobacteria bacterium]